MTILHLDSSITGDNSVSRQISAATVDQLLKADPSATVVRRDLVADPLSHLTLGGSGDEDILDEFLAADTIVIGAPLYNFSVPSQLKAWIDRIAVAGKTFKYGDNGPEGLAGGRRVIIAVSRGGFYAPDNAFEHGESYLKALFNFIGIEPEFVRAEGVNYGPDQREAGIAHALGEVEKLAA
ncbi:FMN-dependent NADH-azoreductase [Sphingomonas jaspsi]|uniref:FMN-dependent NADH-azoreductase n=1 Tax=Sphingomonas jaspsi TaxID=392409 RepID=UPI0004B95CF4|nr:FMN-dependent NADH-azoreductase [Sphingomonas jaspsi]